MINIRLLTIDELRQHHTQKTTDFSYLLGAWQTEKSKVKYQPSPFFDREQNRVDSPRFSSTINNCGWVRSFYAYGEDWAFRHEKSMACPLVLEKYYTPRGATSLKLPIDTDISDSSFLLGAYPQTIASKEETDKLEQAFQQKFLKKTNNSYTFFVPDSTKGYLALRPQKCFEYELDGQRYVRMKTGKLHFLHKTFELSDGKEIKENEHYLLKVEPLKWNKEKQRENPSVETKAYLDVIPFAGISWDKVPTFIDKYFKQEIMQSHAFCLTNTKLKEIAHKRGTVAKNFTTKIKD